MGRRVQETGRAVWYYRVLEEGRVGPGGTLDLLDRPAGDWTLERILHVLYRDTLNVDGLAQLAELGSLTESWRALARRRLERHAVAYWSSRVNGSDRATPKKPRAPTHVVDVNQPGCSSTTPLLTST